MFVVDLKIEAALLGALVDLGTKVLRRDTAGVHLQTEHENDLAELTRIATYLNRMESSIAPASVTNMRASIEALTTRLTQLVVPPSQPLQPPVDPTVDSFSNLVPNGMSPIAEAPIAPTGPNGNEGPLAPNGH